MKIVGLDPSLSNLGIAIGELTAPYADFRLTDLILVETEPVNDRKQVRKNSDDLRRCKMLFTALRKSVQGAGIVFCEMPVGSQSARAMVSYGACMGLLASIDTPIIQMLPNDVKEGVVGDKNATKKQVIEWATARYPHEKWLRRGGSLLNKNEHLADAVATIYSGIRSDQFQQILSVIQFGSTYV